MRAWMLTALQTENPRVGGYRARPDYALKINLQGSTARLLSERADCPWPPIHGAIVPVSKGPPFPICEPFREKHASMVTFEVRRDRDSS